MNELIDIIIHNIHVNGNIFFSFLLIGLTEVEYASFLDKPIIPMHFDDHKATGLLARIINAHESYDIQTKQSLKENFPKVKEALVNARKQQPQATGELAFIIIIVENFFVASMLHRISTEK